MKITLNMGDDDTMSSRQAHAKVLERDILATKKGNWTARNNLAKSFDHLLSSLAHKRSNDPAEVSRYLEAGRNGLYAAAKKYTSGMGISKFQIIALDHIEKAMDRAAAGGGFFARLFGRK
jgi:hypothetical protein